MLLPPDLRKRFLEYLRTNDHSHSKHAGPLNMLRLSSLEFDLSICLQAFRFSFRRVGEGGFIFNLTDNEMNSVFISVPSHLDNIKIANLSAHSTFYSRVVAVTSQKERRFFLFDANFTRKSLYGLMLYLDDLRFKRWMSPKKHASNPISTRRLTVVDMKKSPFIQEAVVVQSRERTLDMVLNLCLHGGLKFSFLGMGADGVVMLEGPGLQGITIHRLSSLYPPNSKVRLPLSPNFVVLRGINRLPPTTNRGIYASITSATFKDLVLYRQDSPNCTCYTTIATAKASLTKNELALLLALKWCIITTDGEKEDGMFRNGDVMLHMKGLKVWNRFLDLMLRLREEGEAASYAPTRAAASTAFVASTGPRVRTFGERVLVRSALRFGLSSIEEQGRDR